MPLDFQQLIPSIPFILEGLKVTLKIVGLAGIIGFAFGILLALCKISSIKPLTFLADIYTSVFRGTPLVLQLMIIFYGSPQLFGTQIEPYTAAILSFSLIQLPIFPKSSVRESMQWIKGRRKRPWPLGFHIV